MTGNEKHKERAKNNEKRIYLRLPGMSCFRIPVIDLFMYFLPVYLTNRLINYV